MSHRRARRPAAVVLPLAVLALLLGACGAVVNDDAERARLAADRAALEQRVAELEAALAAPPPGAPLPTLAERLVLRQFAREPRRAADGALAVDVCLALFGRGDPLAGIPPILTTSCTAIAVPADRGPAFAIDALVGSPVFDCWSAAAPGVRLPACWP